MAQKKTSKRRTKVKNLDARSEKLSAKELKKVKGGAKQLDAASQSGGPTAAMNQKIQELTFN